MTSAHRLGDHLFFKASDYGFKFFPPRFAHHVADALNGAKPPRSKIGRALSIIGMKMHRTPRARLPARGVYSIFDLQTAARLGSTTPKVRPPDDDGVSTVTLHVPSAVLVTIRSARLNGKATETLAGNIDEGAHPAHLGSNMSEK